MDTSNIDIKAVIDQLACIAWKKPVRSHGQIVYKGGPCPFCHQGTDRFAVFPEGEKPHFYCGIHGNGCGAHGDVISFVQQIKGYPSASQAIRELQAMGFQVGDASSATPSRTLPAERNKPHQKWRDQGDALIHAAQKYLWSAVGKEALEYLHGRGLTDETMRRFCLGYWPQWTEYKLADWGLEGDGTFWIRPSILIPCTEKDVLWSINQRITEYKPKEREQMAQGKQLSRYRQVRGSGNGLFNVDAIRPGEVLFVTEGEIDAMTIAQETGYSAVATGSTQGAKISRWTLSLSVASHLLIAFDNDGGKGEKAAEYWTGKLFPQKALYWQPWAKDVNEMLQRGQNIQLWASMGIEVTSRRSHVESASPVPDRQELRGGGQEQRGDGQGCGESGQGPARDKPYPTAAPTFELAYTVEEREVGEALCSTCLDEGRETVATGEHDGIRYCARHLPAQPQAEENTGVSDPLSDPVVQEVARLFNAKVVEVIATSDWPRRKEELLEECRVQAERKQEAPQQPDFWTVLYEKQARFDPTKPVDWTRYGYRRDANGRWYMPRKRKMNE